MALSLERWHARAQLARETAEQTQDAAQRDLLLLYAAECDRIADECLRGFAREEDLLNDLFGPTSGADRYMEAS